MKANYRRRIHNKKLLQWGCSELSKYYEEPKKPKSFSQTFSLKYKESEWDKVQECLIDIIVWVVMALITAFIGYAIGDAIDAYINAAGQ